MLCGHGPHGFTFMLPPLFTLPHLFTSSISVLYLALSNSHSLTSLFGILVYSSTILKPVLQIQKLCQKFWPNLRPKPDKPTHFDLVIRLLEMLDPNQIFSWIWVQNSTTRSNQVKFGLGPKSTRPDLWISLYRMDMSSRWNMVLCHSYMLHSIQLEFSMQI